MRKLFLKQIIFSKVKLILERREYVTRFHLGKTENKNTLMLTRKSLIFYFLKKQNILVYN